jgi:hypothetical protein
MRLPNTVPIPAPEPATPTVAAPAPMNLAAVSMSLEMVLVWKLRLGTSEVRVRGTAKLLRPCKEEGRRQSFFGNPFFALETFVSFKPLMLSNPMVSSPNGKSLTPWKTP